MASGEHSHPLNSDRRRRKYHTDYTDALEAQATRLENFIRNYTKDDPVLRPLFLAKLQGLEHSYDTASGNNTPDIDNFDDIDLLISTTHDLKIDSEGDGDDPFSRNIFVNPFTTELKECLLNTENFAPLTPTSTPISLLNDSSLAVRDENYKFYIIQLFKVNYAIHSPALIKLTSDLETIDYNGISSPTFKLFYNVVLGIGNLYSEHKAKDAHQQFFISVARDSLMGIISKCKLDIYLIMSIYLLSCYEMTQNNLSQSYLLNAVGCSLTQHMGLHISYDSKSHGNLAPKQSPFNLSVLWSICLQDRVITSLLQVPCVIHFKRIISPFYQVITNADNIYHFPELLFSYLSRLWYIYDRFTDQIFTVEFDIGDTNNKLKLLSMGLKTLEELKDTLPKQLNLSRLDNSFNDFYILVFHFNYQVCVLKLNQIFIKENNGDSVSIKKTVIRATVESGEILMKLCKNDAFINKLPFYFISFVHSVGLMLITILSTIKDDSKISSITLNKLRSYLDVVRVLLVKTSKRFKSSSEVLNHLVKVSIKLHVPFAKQFQPSSKPSNPPVANLAPQQQLQKQQLHQLQQQLESFPVVPPLQQQQQQQNEGFFSDSSQFVDSFKDMDTFFQDWENQFPSFDELKQQYKNNNTSGSGQLSGLESIVGQYGSGLEYGLSSTDLGENEAPVNGTNAAAAAYNGDFATRPDLSQLNNAANQPIPPYNFIDFSQLNDAAFTQMSSNNQESNDVFNSDGSGGHYSQPLDDQF